MASSAIDIASSAFSDEHLNLTGKASVNLLYRSTDTRRRNGLHDADVDHGCQKLQVYSMVTEDASLDLAELSAGYMNISCLRQDESVCSRFSPSTANLSY